VATNWARNVEFHAVRIERPQSIDELRSLVASSPKIRALGSGHSFSPVADSAGVLVRLDGLPAVLDVDPAAATVTVGAGLRYADIVEPLHQAGFALANLASLPHISVAGSIATGTHGSGDGLACLSEAVVGLRLVGPDGDIVSFSRAESADDFPGTVVALGSLGIVTELTLRVEPAFDVAQTVYLDVSLDEIAGDWDVVFGAAYSVSAFTNYESAVANVYTKARLDHPRGRWSGSTPAQLPVHPVPSVDPVACTGQLGVPGPWHQRLPHFRPDHTPSAGAELQSEYFVDRKDAPAAVAALRAVGAQVASVVQISEIRTIRGDDLWLSPSYGRDTVAFHFTWIDDLAAVLPVVSTVESALFPLGARPHWGKVSTASPADVVDRYPRLADFVALAGRLDPDGKFRNDFVDSYFG
jgi:xylitol oxidase